MLHIKPADKAISDFRILTSRYTEACNYISQDMFDNGFVLNANKVQDRLYHELRDRFGLKSQMAISSIKTVVARYKTLETQLESHPFKYQDEKSEWHYIPKTLDWIGNPIHFHRAQADLVYGRDYSFPGDRKCISINTLSGRHLIPYDVPDYYNEYFDKNVGWKFGTGKLLTVKGQWYLHIPVTKEIDQSYNESIPKHIVGIDRGLRFVVNTYDDNGNCIFFNGEEILRKHATFLKVRAELQAKGTKSAKRKLKLISGRENRWMADVNHRLSKTLIDEYGEGTLFVLEDLTGVSFSDENLSSRSKEQRSDLRSWSFYQFEQFLTYKAQAVGAEVIKVSPRYTSQRCPKCGRIRKENRNHHLHEYICDRCGYRSNDDRVGAMNIMDLGLQYVSGVSNPCFEKQE